MNDYQPTHVSKTDGSPAMLHSENGALCIMMNEDGDLFADRIDDWQPIRKKVYCAVAECEFEAVLEGKYCATHTLLLAEQWGSTRIGQYEAERWRQMADELDGQADRLKQMCMGGTSAEWRAIEAIQSAARSLFGAFAGVTREAMKHGEREAMKHGN